MNDNNKFHRLNSDKYHHSNGSSDNTRINVISQYTKNFSFKNPNAPLIFKSKDIPQISIGIDVIANKISKDDFEVTLKLNGQVSETVNNDEYIKDKHIYFQFDLEYAGLFKLTNFSKEQLDAVVMVECPYLLFPFVRQIIADSVNKGGFPPLYIDPIDFAYLYLNKNSKKGSGNFFVESNITN